MTALSDIAEIRTGTAFKAAKVGVPFVQGRHLKDGRYNDSALSIGHRPKRGGSDAALRSNDVLVDTRGTTNWAVCFGGEPFVIHAVLDIAIVRLTTEQMLPEYLTLFINLPSTQNHLAKFRSIATIARLGIHELGNLDVPIPPLDRQCSMVSLLKEMQAQRDTETKLGEARERFTNEILRKSAEGVSMLDSNPAWTTKRQTDRARDVLASSLEKKGHLV